MEYLKQYARVNEKGNLVIPIEIVNHACIKQTNGRCVDKKGNVDKEYFAKKLFGEGNYQEVKFEKDIPLYCFTNEIIDGVATKDQIKVDENITQKSDLVKSNIEERWMKTIRDNLDVDDMSNWKSAEKMVAFSKRPTPIQFEEYSAAYTHN